MPATMPSAVRQALTTRLEALTPLAGYRQSTNAAWRESFMPSVPEMGKDGNIRNHLAFFFDDTEVIRASLSRGNVAEGLSTVSPMTLRYLYRLRPKNQVEDWDAAGDSAVEVLQHLIDWTGAEATLQITLDDGDAMVREQIHPDWLLVTIEFVVVYCISLTA